MHNDILLDPSKYFRCKNGQVLESIEDLKEEFERNEAGINLENFEFHSKNSGNDYANWLEGVFGLKEEAEILRHADSPGESLGFIKGMLEEVEILDEEENKENELVKKEAEEKIKSEQEKDKNPKLKIFQKLLKKKSNESTDSTKLDEESMKETENNKKPKLKIFQKLLKKKSKDSEELNEEEKNVKNSEDMAKEKKETKEKKIEDKLMFQRKDLIKKDEEGKPIFIQNSEIMLENMKNMKKNSFRNIDFLQQKEALYEEYKNIYDEISQARKEGFDVFIASVKLKNVKSKIKYLEASGDEEEAQVVLDVLLDIKQELEESKQNKELDLKEEIIQAAKESNQNINQSSQEAE